MYFVYSVILAITEYNQGLFHHAEKSFTYQLCRITIWKHSLQRDAVRFQCF
jgi:RES domain-containing protein